MNVDSASISDDLKLFYNGYYFRLEQEEGEYDTPYRVCIPLTIHQIRLLHERAEQTLLQKVNLADPNAIAAATNGPYTAANNLTTLVVTWAEKATSSFISWKLGKG